MMSALDVTKIRGQFPAFRRQERGCPVAYFDGPAGSQVPESVIEAVSNYLANTNANCGAPIGTSRDSDAILSQARQTLADFLGASDPLEIVFGANMTTCAFSLSRALARTWKPGDEIIVTQLDHDANVTPWVRAAESAGATVRHVPVDLATCTLDMAVYDELLSERTRFIAVGYASNAVGTVNPVREMISKGHAVGALTFVDAVHMAPHRLIDVAHLDCDFLACSAYKFFGPHVGVLWGRYQLLDELRPDKLRPAPESVPGKWMTGTQHHEGIAGASAAVDYIASLGDGESRRERLRVAFERIERHEEELLRQLLEGLKSLPYRLWGLSTRRDDADRVPTVSLTHEHIAPQELARQLAQAGLYCWPGNHYAYPFTTVAGLEPLGTLRIGLLHYNTSEEVARLLEELARLGTP
ncbi:MAG: cysteine desulfurase-like protein [Planctomycetaceae bacterium]